MISLFGHGYVGTAIANYFESVGEKFYWYHHTDKEYIVLGSVIINATGYVGIPNVDAAEDDKTECIRGNIVWPLKFEYTHKHFPIIHISSGCVYNGYKGGGWTEEDKPNFTGSFYSLTKALAQEELDLKNNYLLRIRMPFGKDNSPRNYLTKLRAYPKLIDAENSLSCLEDVAGVVLSFARNLPKPGTYNVCNVNSITAREITEMMGIQKEWFTMDEFEKSVKAPRSFCTLSTKKLEAIYPMRDVRTALLDCI